MIPITGNKNINEVTADDIDKMQSRILKRTKKTANASRSGKVAIKNSLAYTRQIFNLANKKRLKKRLIENNPVMEIESSGASGSRSRILSFEEIWKFWNRFEMLSVPPVTAKALKFALVTMQRSVEVRNIRYGAFKADENVWQMEMHETKQCTACH